MVVKNEKVLLVSKTSAVTDYTQETKNEKTEDVKDNNLADEDLSKPVSLWSSTTLRTKVLFVDMIVLSFLTSFCAGIPSPFFSRVVISKGGTLLYSAVILQSLLLSMAFFCVIFGCYQQHLGRKYLYTFGVVVTGVCQISFGFIYYIENIKVFTSVGTIIRVFQGLGEAAFSTACTSVICSEYPKHVTKVFGFTEAAVGAGYLLGPVFGGTLYEHMGMVLPMAVSGGVVSLTLPLNWYLLQDCAETNSTEKAEEFNVQKWLSNPYVILILCGVGTTFGTFGYCDVAITTYLKTIDFSTADVGLVLFSVGAGYCVCAVFIGFFIEEKPLARKIVMALGFVGYCGVLFVYSPRQIKPFIYAGSIFLGLFGGMATVPGFEDLLEIGNKGNTLSEEANMHFQGILSGTWYASIGIGMFIFPVIGSIVNKYTSSFVWSIGAITVAGFALTILLFIFLFLIDRCNK